MKRILMLSLILLTNGALALPSADTPVEIVTESQSVVSLDNAFMIGGTWTSNHTRLTIPNGSGGVEIDTGLISFLMSYQRHLAHDWWLGPYLAYSLSNVKSGTTTSTSAELRPGIEVRKFFGTGENSYIAPYARIGWMKSVADSPALDANFGGFNFGGGIGLGQRLGINGKYVFESYLDFSRASLSGEAGDDNTKIKVEANYFSFGVMIGNRF